MWNAHLHVICPSLILNTNIYSTKCKSIHIFSNFNKSCIWRIYFSYFLFAWYFNFFEVIQLKEEPNRWKYRNEFSCHHCSKNTRGLNFCSNHCRQEKTKSHHFRSIHTHFLSTVLRVLFVRPKSIGIHQIQKCLVCVHLSKFYWLIHEANASNFYFYNSLSFLIFRRNWNVRCTDWIKSKIEIIANHFLTFYKREKI